MIESEKATLSPWQLSPPFSPILNQLHPNNPQQLQLIAKFPKGVLGQSLGKTVFSNLSEGSIKVISIRLASIPDTGFPASQHFPIFIDSFKEIEFDENGALKNLGPTPEPTPEPEEEEENPFLNIPDQEPVVTPLSLDLPAGMLSSNNLITLPPAQEGLQYLFQLKAKNGKGAHKFGLSTQAPASDGSFLLGDSGVRLKPSGNLVGEPSNVTAGNYRFTGFVRDDLSIIEFSLDLSVHDAFGNPVGLSIQASFPEDTHTCIINEPCEAFFTASKGVEPYVFAHAGEQPVEETFLTPNKNQAFYRFIPETPGQFFFTITAVDTLKHSTSRDITLEIITPETDVSFKFSAEQSCDFLDLGTQDEYYEAFQYTCRNQIMRGFEGLIRSTDSLNRAEAAKITSLIVADQSVVDETFSPFAAVSQSSFVNYNDVTVGDWYASYVYYLFRQGIIIDNTLYRPADTLNAAEAMKLVFESFGELNTQVFDDLDALPEGDWFEGYQTLAQYLGATIGNVAPESPAQRGWIADVLLRLHQAYPNTKFK
ncbi:MAG: hypothetical protein P1V18_03170 [Candidatus Gracilibacteria bacterium]|nr:hypothetical protein [Candidatus Gracilibacteria bacterium]